MSENEAVAGAGRAESAGGVGSKPCIMVVDDEPLNRELLRRVLSRQYRVLEAEDGVQALEVLREHGDDIALVLCDQLMPNMTGTELAAAAREARPELTFVLLTGYDDDPDVNDARRSGLVAHVVAKPWRGAVLKQLIADSISG